MKHPLRTHGAGPVEKSDKAAGIRIIISITVPNSAGAFQVNPVFLYPKRSDLHET
jgi:hypothetical protein